MNIVLYSTHCPKCNILETKLKQSGIVYEEINDMDLMLSKGFTSVPKLEVDGVVYDYKDAVDWIKEQ